jgi:hypothetical protein
MELKTAAAYFKYFPGATIALQKWSGLEIEDHEDNSVGNVKCVGSGFVILR